MRITEQALIAIKNSTRIKTLLALQLGTSVYTIERRVMKNQDNGLLTTATALAVIREETGLTDSEILEVMEPQS